jgi:hypothetical protein
MAPPINTTPAVVARVRSWATANGWTKSRYAAEAHMSDTTLRGFGEPDWNPTRETLERLEALIPNGWQAGDPLPGKKRRAA